MMMIGIRGSARISVRWTSNPSMCGMRTSSTTQCGRCCVERRKSRPRREDLDLEARGADQPAQRLANGLFIVDDGDQDADLRHAGDGIPGRRLGQ
jgi:hypothetical protein